MKDRYADPCFTILCLLANVAICAVDRDQTYELADPKLYAIRVSENTPALNVQSGETIEREISIENVGRLPIHIERVVESSCGCGSTASVSSKTLEVGDKGSLRFNYKTSGKKVGKNITKLEILTRNKKVIPIEVEAVIKRNVTVSPKKLDLGEITPGQRVTGYFTIGSTLPIQVDDILVESSLTEHDSKITPKEINGRSATGRTLQEFIVEFSWLPTGDAWIIDETLNIVLRNYDGRKRRVFKVAISAHTTPVIEIDPGSLLFSFTKEGDRVRKTFSVRSLDDKKLEILGVSGPDNIKLSHEVVTISPNQKNLNIELVMHTTPKTMTRFPLKVEIANNQQNDTMTISCVGIYRKNK